MTNVSRLLLLEYVQQQIVMYLHCRISSKASVIVVTALNILHHYIVNSWGHYYWGASTTYLIG